MYRTMQLVLEAAIYLHTEFINNPTDDVEKKADDVWEMLTYMWAEPDARMVFETINFEANLKGSNPTEQKKALVSLIAATAHLLNASGLLEIRFREEDAETIKALYHKTKLNNDKSASGDKHLH